MKSVVFSQIPFEFEKMPSDEEMIEKNLFGNNIGNEYFFNAVIKSLRSDTHEIVRYEDGMNLEQFDNAVLIQANQIRNGALEWIKSDLKLINSCSIPFIIVSVGSDSDDKFSTSLNEEVREAIKECYTEILKRTESIGVRGDWTKKVLVEECKIPEDRIDVIGCPSVRYFGKNFKKFPRQFKKYTTDLKIAVNYTAYHYNEDEAIYLNQLLKVHPNSYFFLTDKVEADLLYRGISVPENRKHDLMPSTMNHFMIRQNRCRFLATQEKMMDCLSTFDFSIGSRIHQSVVAILSGCPAILIAHSQRVLEIAEHHKIPYIMRDELIREKPSYETLYYRACAGMIDFYKNYDACLEEYVRFLEKNGLSVNENYK